LLNENRPSSKKLLAPPLLSTMPQNKQISKCSRLGGMMLVMMLLREALLQYYLSTNSLPENHEKEMFNQIVIQRT
jgi:hypothetical protein